MLAESEIMDDQEEAQAQPWPLSADFPGAALEAVLAALPRPAKRCLRATCTAARAAIDASLTSLDATKGQTLLPAAAPRLARLESLQCFATDPNEAASLLATLPLLPATLTRLQLYIADAPLQQVQVGALIAAIAARSSLKGLDLTTNTRRATTAMLLALGARLPSLTEFRLAADNYINRDAPPALELPWHQLQDLKLSGAAISLLPQLLAREAPALRSLEIFSYARDDVRTLSGAPWFSQLTRLDLGCGPGVAHLFAAAPHQLALQELRVADGVDGFPLAAARRLAATAMPLRRLELLRPAAGVVDAIAGAPWASSLQALQLSEADDFEAPAAAGAAAAVLAAAPLGALTSLQVTDIALGPDAAPLSTLLAAPWAPGLCELVLGAPYQAALFGATADATTASAAVSALAAAPLPALCVLGLERMCLDAAALSGALAAAPWLPQLEQLTLNDEHLSLQAFEALAALQLPSLASLVLGSDGLSAPTLTALAAAPWFPRLQRLRLVAPWATAAYYACRIATVGGVFDVLKSRGGAVELDHLLGE